MRNLQILMKNVKSARQSCQGREVSIEPTYPFSISLLGLVKSFMIQKNAE